MEIDSVAKQSSKIVASDTGDPHHNSGPTIELGSVPDSNPEPGSRVASASVDEHGSRSGGSIQKRLRSSKKTPRSKVAEGAQKVSSRQMQVEYGDSGSEPWNQQQRLGFEERHKVGLDPNSKGAPIAWRIGKDEWRCGSCDWDLTDKSCYIKSCPRDSFFQICGQSDRLRSESG